MSRSLFRKQHRLVSNSQFRFVLANKCCCSNGLMRVYAAPNQLTYPRFGASVSKRSGNAVIRNRLKRLAREAFRLEQHNIPSNYDYLLIYAHKLSKKKMTGLASLKQAVTFDEVRESLLKLTQAAANKAHKRLQKGDMDGRTELSC